MTDMLRRSKGAFCKGIWFFYMLGGLEGRARFRLRGKGTLGGRTSMSVTRAAQQGVRLGSLRVRWKEEDSGATEPLNRLGQGRCWVSGGTQRFLLGIFSRSASPDESRDIWLPWRVGKDLTELPV